MRLDQKNAEALWKKNEEMVGELLLKDDGMIVQVCGNARVTLVLYRRRAFRKKVRTSTMFSRASRKLLPLTVLVEQRCRRKTIHSDADESVSDVRQPGADHCEASLRLDERRRITSSKKRSESGVMCASNRRNARTSARMPFRSPHIAGGSRGSCPIRRATSPPTFNRSTNASAAEFVGIRRWPIHSASRRDSRSSESKPYIELKLVTPIPPTRVPRTHAPRAFTRC